MLKANCIVRVRLGALQDPKLWGSSRKFAVLNGPAALSDLRGNWRQNILLSTTQARLVVLSISLKRSFFNWPLVNYMCYLYLSYSGPFTQRAGPWNVMGAQLLWKQSSMAFCTFQATFSETSSCNVVYCYAVKQCAVRFGTDMPSSKLTHTFLNWSELVKLTIIEPSW